MKIELLKTECEWSQPSLGCYISVNSNLLEVITPLNNPHEVNSVEIPSEGTLRLVIRDMGKTDGYLGSLSVPISMLEDCHLVWLPLFTSSASDALSQIEGIANGPRIMLAVASGEFEHHEVSSYAELYNNSISGNCTASKIIASSPTEEFFSRISDFKNLDENTNGDKQQKVIDVLNVELENYQGEIEKEKEKNKALQKKIDQLIEVVKSNSNRALNRENSLLDLMNEKEKQINQCIEINIDLQNYVRKSDLEKKSMQEMIEKYEEQAEYTNSLEAEIKRYQEMLKAAENAREELTNTLIECSNIDSDDESTHTQKRCAKTPEQSRRIGRVTEDQMYRKSSFHTKLKFTEKILEEKVNCTSEKKIKGFDMSQEMDKHYIDIKKIIQKSLGKDASRIERIRECFYRVNDIETSLAICDDGLYVKNGNSLMTLNEFWNNEKKLREITSVSPMQCAKSPAWTDREVENDYKKLLSKVSPQKNFLKSTESSQNKLRQAGKNSSKMWTRVLRSHV